MATPTREPLQIGEPVGIVSSPWFQIEGQDTLRVLHYLFGDQFSEAVL